MMLFISAAKYRRNNKDLLLQLVWFFFFCSFWLSGKDKNRLRNVIFFLLFIYCFMLDSTTWIIMELHVLRNTVQVRSASPGSSSAEINRHFDTNFYRIRHRDNSVTCKGKKFGQAGRQIKCVWVNWSQSFSASSKTVFLIKYEKER